VRARRLPGEPHIKGHKANIEGYQIRATLEVKPQTAQTLTRQRSRFIVATNQLDATQWPAQRLLEEYKHQQKVERGFRFLKDPLFFTSSIFVKSPQRIEALALIMALTLLVYTHSTKWFSTSVNNLLQRPFFDGLCRSFREYI
jgi:transposase